MDIMTPEEWNNENYPYPNCRSILHNGREMEKRMKEYSEYVLRESQKTETSDEALPIGSVVKSWSEIKEGDEFIVRCKVVKGKFELNLD